MAITPDTSKGQVVTHHFGQVNVAASQTAVALPVAAVSGQVTGETMLFDFDLLGFTYDLSAAGTAGVFTIVPTINGTAISSAYQATVGTTTKGSVRIPRGAVRGVAGDVVGVKITTNASWDGITADLAVVVAALWRLDGV